MDLTPRHPDRVDVELVERVDDLLRNDPRLAAAAGLIGEIAVLPPKPPKAPKPRKRRAPRPGEELQAPEPEGPPPAPTLPPQAWLKVATAAKIGDDLRQLLGDRWRVIVKINGGLWARLSEADRDRALVLALRGLAEVEKEDGTASVVLEKAPIQCHPDTADDLAHLIAALGPDGAEGAIAVGAAEGFAADGADPDLAPVVRIQDLVGRGSLGDGDDGDDGADGAEGDKA